MPEAGGHERGRVIVAGGSIAGLFAAGLLHRLGFAVDVFERSAEALESRGAGIVTHPELFAALAELGAPADGTLGVEVRGRITYDRDGRALGERPLPQIMMSWDRLYRLVRRGFPDARYHAGRAVEGIEQDADGVTVRLAGGGVERASWLIAADGVGSGLRRLLLPELEPVYAGYAAWRGLIEEGAMSAAARAALGSHLAFCLPPGEQMVGYMVPGADEATAEGERRYNFVWYRPAGVDGLEALLTGKDRRRYALSVPPGQVADDAVAGMRAAADALLSPAFREVVHRERRPFLQAIYDLESPRLVFGRVILIGDAAFVARPHAGLGATKAALDATTLARALAAPDPAAALVGWEKERLGYGRALVERARWLGAWLDDPDAARRMTTWMAETAVSDWMRP